MTQAPSLTRREKDVLRLAAEGYRQAEIATELGVTLSTVDTHVTNILAKLGARSTAQAVAIVLTSSATMSI